MAKKKEVFKMSGCCNGIFRPTLLKVIIVILLILKFSGKKGKRKK